MVEYNKLREEIKTTKPEAHDWIERSLENCEENWALCKDDGNLFHIMTTNASESFNGVLKGARSLPIKALVARTFFRSVEYLYKRREKGEGLNSKPTPKLEAKIKARAIDARRCRLVRFGRYKWQVINGYGEEYDVMINDSDVTCTCRIPLLQKIPCAHVMAACSAQGFGGNTAHHDFASEWYSVESYRATYDPEFNLVRDKKYWDPYNGPLILAPPVRRLVGRPKSTRCKNVMDEHQTPKTNRCNKCGSQGHNRKRCTSVA